MSILIRNGWLADGTGNPIYPADVMIEDDRIAAVEHLPEARAERIIDAKGKIVCPGYIDCHSHTDWTIHSNPEMQSTVRQGVTTEIIGNCGFSMAPLGDRSRTYCQQVLKHFGYDGRVDWSSFAEYLETVGQMKTSENLACFVGHSAIRAAVGITSPSAVGMLENARERGIDIQTDCVGYEDGIGKLAAILPPWVLEGGIEQAALMMKDESVRQRLCTECDRYWRFLHHGDWFRVTMVQDKPFPEIVGKNFEEIAELWGKDPWDCYFDIMAAAGAGMDDLIAVGLMFTEAHVAEMVSHPLFSLETDFISSDLNRTLRDILPFKASFGGMIYFLTCHVQERKTLRLEDAVRKMTSMPATHFRLRDRGLLRKGYFADVVVLDYENLDDGANDSQSFAYAKGVEHVIVNGTMVVDNSEHTGARPGRILPRA